MRFASGYLLALATVFKGAAPNATNATARTTRAKNETTISSQGSAQNKARPLTGKLVDDELAVLFCCRRVSSEEDVSVKERGITVFKSIVASVNG